MLDKRSESTYVKIQSKLGVTGIEIDIGPNRPRTAIGPQGDHVSAYALFKYCVIAVTKESDIQDAYKLILQVIDSYTDNPDETTKLSEEIKEHISSIMEKAITVSELKQLQEKLADSQHLSKKVLRACIENNTRYLENLVEILIEKHLTLRNKLALTSYPIEGNIAPTMGEGTRVKKALKFLKSVDEFNGESAEEVIEAIYQLFWYPKIPDDKLINLDTPEGRKTWKKHQGKYNKGTKPRDNNINTLCQVIANHLNIVLCCFETLREHSSKIIEPFITRVLQDWKIDKQQQDELIDSIKKLLMKKVIELDPYRTTSSSKETSSGEFDGNKTIERGLFPETTLDDSDEPFDYDKGLSSPVLPMADIMAKMKAIGISDTADSEESDESQEKKVKK